MYRIELTQAELTKRWSKKLVEQFAPKPSEVRKNKHYYGYTYIYYLSDIKKIERKAAFKKAMEKTAKRKAAYKANKSTYVAAHNAMEQRLREEQDALLFGRLMWADNADEILSNPELLLNNAIDHYNDFHNYRITIYCSNYRLREIAANYIRHQLTNYDDALNEREDDSAKYAKNAYNRFKEFLSKKAEILTDDVLRNIRKKARKQSA